MTTVETAAPADPAPPLVADPRVGAAHALGAGLLLAASIPPMGFWPLAVPGLVLLDRALAGCSARRRFWRGALTGVALFVPTIWWMHALTLPGYVIANVLFSTMLGAACAACPPWCGRWLALPGAWVLCEAVRGRWPFGGVPLSNLAVGQVAGPLAGVARVGGSLLVGGVTVVAAIAVAAGVRRAWMQAGAAAAAVVAAVAMAALAPSGTGTGRMLDVAVVQGGGPQGTRADETDPREVFERHAAASALVPSGIDLVLWPEDVVNIEGPLTANPEGPELADLARRLDATLVVGVIEGAGPVFHNVAVAFGPDGTIVDRHEKERRVPFGEFVPFRSLLEPIAGDALPDSDAVSGEGEAVLDTPAGRFGVVISWEVFFPDRARDAIGNGGVMLLNPTNGSSFTGTQVQSQQVASSQLRAIETGRWVLQAAPTGFSAIVTPGGHVVDRTGVSEQAILLGTVEQRTGRTWAVALGDWLALGLAAGSVGGGWWYELHRRRINAGR